MLLGPDAALLLVTLLVFGCAALLVLASVDAYAQRERVRQRFGASAPGAAAAGAVHQGARSRLRIDPARLGLDAGARRRLRVALVRAGFFDPDAVATYALARVVVLLACPLVAWLVVARLAPRWEPLPTLAVALLAFVVASVLPPAFLSRRQRSLETRYRVAFPDLLDMLVVCINAGLSLEAALARVARELGPENRELKANLDLMAGEMRAGRSTPDALRDLAERLGLREARSFAALLQQTIELGTDVALALTTFSDEMRDRRMARAEEAAAALPPKLTLPLGLFIFPVVLIVILTPAVMRILAAVGP